jgi:hypothetical protein
MKIKIKRAVSDNRLINCEGTHLEVNGYHFCFVEAEDEGLFFLIELSTGASVKSIDADYYTKRSAFNIAKESINKRTKFEIEDGINKFKQKYDKLHYPVNESF